MKPRLEAWCTARGQKVVAVMILCSKHAWDLRAQLATLRSAMRPYDATLFRARHPGFLREFVSTSPGCGECAAERGKVRIWAVDGLKLSRDELAREDALA